MASGDGTGKETIPVQAEKNRTQNGDEKIQAIQLKYLAQFAPFFLVKGGHQKVFLLFLP